MDDKIFVGLHNHSVFSLQDSISPPEDMARKAKELGMNALAITDHGTLASWLQFRDACNKYGIKPLFGLEAYFVDEVTEVYKTNERIEELQGIVENLKKEKKPNKLEKIQLTKAQDNVHEMQDIRNKLKKYNHLILIAKNAEGCQNLIKIHNDSVIDGIYYKPRCFPANTIVDTIEGPKSIENIDVGDYVLTHLGNYKKVLSTFKTKTNELIEIRTQHGTKTYATAEHPFLSSTTETYKCGQYKINNLTNINWTNAEDLKRGDFLCVPKLKCGNGKDSYTYIENDNVFTINLTEDFCKILGLYISEGWKDLDKYNNTMFHFAFHFKEKYLHNFVFDYFKNNHDIIPRMVHKNNSTKINIANKNFQNILSNLCGDYAENKHLPYFWKELNEKQLFALIDGYICGDGSVYHGATMGTVSKKLAYEVSEALNRLGILAKPHNHNKAKRRKLKNNTEINQQHCYGISIRGKQFHNFKFSKIRDNANFNTLKNPYIMSNAKENENYFFSRIISTKIIYKETDVFNIEVEDDNSYLANGWAVHNCDWAVLEKHKGGLVASSACLGGRICKLLEHDDFEGAITAARKFEQLFGKGNFYLELQLHDIKLQSETNLKIIKVSEATGIPMVITCDSHYIDEGQHTTRGLIRQLDKEPDEINNDDQLTDLFIKNEDMLIKSWHDYMPGVNSQILAEAILNTRRIADMVEVYPFDTSLKFPHFESGDLSQEDYLTKAAWDGLKRKGLDKNPIYVKRLKLELDTVNPLGFASYFNIVSDIVSHAKKHQPVGIGRGSVGGSLLAYVIDISGVDPVKFELYFERFLDKSKGVIPPTFGLGNEITNIQIDYDKVIGDCACQKQH